MRLGTIQQAAAENNLSRGYFTTQASRTNNFPPPIDTARRPYLYDLDAIATWLANRPGRGTRTDLHGTVVENLRTREVSQKN